MADVKITLRDERNAVYTTPAGQEFPYPIVVDEFSRKLVKRFNWWVAQENSPYERADLELLGQLLYQMLFPASAAQARIRDLFEKDYAHFIKTSPEGDRFRLTLELHEEAGDLATFPWEFLFLPDDRSSEGSDMTRGFFLAGQQNKLILTRYVPRAPKTKFIPTERAVRILVVFSHPQELGNIKSEVTREVINGIRALESKSVEVRVEDNITYNALHDLINKEPPVGDADQPTQKRMSFRPDILHFIGHGRPNELALVRDPEEIKTERDLANSDDGPVKEARWSKSQEIQALFSDHTPRLVFLHACESATAGSIDSFTNLARELVYSRIPCVVAMQYTISNRDAGVFARTFYEEIRKGGRVDDAVRAGRAALGRAQDRKEQFGDRRFGTPVVYFQETSGEPLVLVPKTPDQTGSSSAPQTPSLATGGKEPASTEKRVCPRCKGEGEDFCGECGFMFFCSNDKCRRPILKVTSRFCVKCQTPIVQPPYAEGPAAHAAVAASDVVQPTSRFEERDNRPGHDQLSPGGDAPSISADMQPPDAPGGV